MHLSIAGRVDAGCAELLCSPVGTRASVYTLAVGSQRWHPGSTKPVAGSKSLRCRTKATLQPVSDNKLLLFSL